MGRKNRSNLIPDGWQGCPTMGSGFVDERFFVFKTPLKPELNSKIPVSERFSIENIFERALQMNHSRIGMWIDLTNTSRYYNPSQIQNRGCEYVKLACEGHGKPPSSRTISAFCNMVHHFFNRNRRDYVGVHCTHGFNRTGYLICCYLIRFRKYTAAQAVGEFAKHRQPGIYRQIYIDDLYTMSFPLERPIQVSDPEWLQERRLTFQNTTCSDSSNGEIPGQVQASSSCTASSSISTDECKQILNCHSSRALLLPSPTSSTSLENMSRASTSNQPPVQMQSTSFS